MKNKPLGSGKYAIIALMVLAFVITVVQTSRRRAERLSIGVENNGDTSQVAESTTEPYTPGDSYTYIYAAENNSPVKNLRARAGDTVIFLEWDSVPELDGRVVDGYTIYSYSENRGDFTLAGGTSETSKTFYYLTNDAEYRFKIAARYIINGREELSEFSNPIALTPRYSGRIRLSMDFLSLKKGESDRIIARRFGEEIPLTWTSSDETVATIDENGVVTAISAGYSEISGTDGNTTVAAAVIIDRMPNWIETGASPRYALDEESGWYVPTEEREDSEAVTLAFVGDLMTCIDSRTR